MPRILVTNDDGIYSEGLRKLAAACREVADVIIVAPDREQSAASHALTLNRPLRLLQIETDEWIVDGTPADCVNLAILKLMKGARPDLIVSGINFGPNLGDDVTYSGTISAAFEGALLNIPSIAFSALVGIWRGFTFELLSLAGWFLAYVAARWLQPWAAGELPIGERGSLLNPGAAFACVFIVALIVWGFVARGMVLDLGEGLKGLRTPIRFSDAELAPARRSPKLGEDA
jgi:hypothetical protein